MWSIETFQLVKSIQAHQGSVLCLYLSDDGSVLFSSAGDAIINVGRSGRVFSPDVRVRFGALTVFLGMECENLREPLQYLFYFRRWRCILRCLFLGVTNRVLWCAEY